MVTVATSVEVVGGPLPDAAALDARLEQLRRRFPRAIVERYLASLPVFGERVMVSAGAAVVGDVRLGDDVSVWYGAVLRGDLAPVTQRAVIPPRSLVLGVPGKVVKTLTADDEAFHRAHAGKYVRLKENYLRDALRGG